MSTTFIDRIAVESDGEGDAVIALHGLGGTSNTWTPLMGALSRHRVIRPDLPGSGRSHRIEDPLSIASLVDAVLQVADRLRIDRFHLVGHSMGTIVAMHLAVREPKHVRSLALFGPLLAPPDAAKVNIRARGAKARSEGVEGMAAIADAVATAGTSTDTRRHRPLAFAAARESLMRQDPGGYARNCDALADATPAAVETLAIPVLLVTGEDDVVAPPQAVRAIAERIAGSRFVSLPRCGHWTPFERPDECARELGDFLARVR
jgi:pimeloyl-ACP methyl ester carboxylesterase